MSVYSDEKSERRVLRVLLDLEMPADNDFIGNLSNCKAVTACKNIHFLRKKGVPIYSKSFVLRSKKRIALYWIVSEEKAALRERFGL